MAKYFTRKDYQRHHRGDIVGSIHYQIHESIYWIPIYCP